MKKFESTNLFYFIDSYDKYPSKEERNDKIPLRYWNETKEEFLRLTRNGMDYERFLNVENVTFENIKALLKANDNFFAFSSDSYIDFRWYEGKKIVFFMVQRYTFLDFLIQMIMFIHLQYQIHQMFLINELNIIHLLIYVILRKL